MTLPDGGQIKAFTADQQIAESERKSLLCNWETEVFCFLDQNATGLADQLQLLSDKIGKSDKLALKDLAFTINSKTKAKISKLPASSMIAQLRLGLICQSVDDLKTKLSLASAALQSRKSFYEAIPLAQTKEIYFGDNIEVTTGKLAFILPGLGASYPNMLADLCLHFPDVKEVFDFVDDLAVKAGSTELPSQRIFPPRNLNGTISAETSATLAAMDSAVITVLMTEWALFMLLQKLKITPDVLLGVSTGEFAALVMSDAIDILSAAPIFYHLSTSVARSIPQERLAELRSLQVLAPYTVIKPYLERANVYLSADLSENQVLISGNKIAVEDLAQEFETAGIQAYMLPSAIPYHTPLVEGIIDADRQEILDLEMNAPQISAWSCSTALPYPTDPKAIKEATTQLFSRPILFRESIEALYADGVRKFVEVGPKGMLIGFISEILSGKPHLAIASNRSAYSAILQLNHMLAALFCQGVSMDLDYLYALREPKIIDFEQLRESTEDNKSSALPYPVQAEENEVISSYLQTIANFQKQLVNVQEEIMSSYLRISTNEYNENDYMDPITLDPKWQEYIATPESCYLSGAVSQIQEESEQPIVCRSIKDDLLPTDEGTLALCAQHVLTPSETQTFESWSNVKKRREWLLGRIAAKEAVRDLVSRFFDVALSSTDVEIYADENGKPIVSAIQIDDKQLSPLISISHKNGVAVAITALEDQNNCRGIGVDVEIIESKEDGFENLLLSDSELAQFKELLVSKRDLLLSKMWSVKEAVGKALGNGLSSNPKNLHIVFADPQLTKFQVKPMHLATIATSKTGTVSERSNVSTAPDTIQASCIVVNETIISWAIF